jgi:16S rRNA (adenine1518-N6/adenine1519-N6)-dimethyltransferase
MILTIQHEVAMRICASPPDMSTLALSVQVYGEPKVIDRIPAGAFYPMPRVDSAILRIQLYPTARVPVPYLDPFFQLVKAGFSQKRKNLRNSLSAGLRLPKDAVVSMLESASIDPRRRAETLSLEEWRDLSVRLADF